MKNEKLRHNRQIIVLTVEKVEWNILFSKCRPSDSEVSYPERMIATCEFSTLYKTIEDWVK